MTPTPPGGRHLPPAVRVAPGHSLRWLLAGWRNLVRHPLPWLLTGLVSFLILLLCTMLAPAVPLLGPMLPIVTLVLTIAGLLRAAWHQEQGETPQLADIVAGVRTHTMHLVLLGVFFSLPLVLISLLGYLALGGTLLAGVLGAALGQALQSVAGGIAAVISYLLTTMAVFTVCWSLLLLCLFFAPALVMFHNAAPLDAMQASFAASVRNLPAILCFAILLSLLFTLAMIPAGLGVFVLIPVFAGALYQAYRDIFPHPALPAPETP